MTVSRIGLVSASAGTGKTYYLCSQLQAAVASGIQPQSILATTFTNRAAAELLARGRERLLQAGSPRQALALMLARLGTVNSVFGHIVAEYALAQGRSPVAMVLPEAAQKAVFRVAADAAIGRHAPALSRLATRFGFAEGRHPLDWRDMLSDLVATARLNGLDAAGLEASGKRSWEGLQRALPSPAPDGAALDVALARAIDQALMAMGEGDRTKTTLDVLSDLRILKINAEAERLTWADWARAAKLKAAKVSDGLLDTVRAAAARHPEHPLLAEELRRFIFTLFAAAAEAMRDTQAFKRQRGLVDFVDQEVEALELLADGKVASAIAGGIDLMLVDEFQDTSPIQLALFLRLAGLVPRTVFVGDAKQAIYGFRGADPALVTAIAERIERETGRPPEALGRNWRSRPDLVAFPQRLLGPAMATLGIEAMRAEVQPVRQDLPMQAQPLALWRVPGSNFGTVFAALAARVARLVAEGAAMPVALRDRPSETRPLRGGDVAVLVRSNRNAEAVATALAATGLKVALARDGLLERAECALALAGLRALADASDSLALAEIAHLLEGDAMRPAWLDATLAEGAGPQALRQMDFARALDAARPELLRLTPAEALDLAIRVLDLPALLPRWGDPAARHANLGALRGLAAEYEATCQRDRAPGSAAGLAAWIEAQDKVEQPASPDPDAVQVLTCHRSKGLEWPCVILADLDADDEPRLFNKPVAMSGPGGLDPADPLRDRWVRLWPWPYGAQAKNVHLDTSALATEEGELARRETAAEQLRLLYVALTRARDYLILAPRLKESKAETKLSVGWLDLLPGDPRPLELPPTGEAVRLHGKPLAMAVETLDAPTSNIPTAAPTWTTSLPSGPAPDFPSRRQRPSALIGGIAPAFEVIQLGARLPLTGPADMQRVGEALHGFFAADRPGASREWRLACAGRLLQGWGASELSVADALLAADRLWTHLASEWPGATRRHEWPVISITGGQMLSGRADLVVEHAAGLAVYDHKSNPGDKAGWPELVAEYAPQLSAYAGALRAATGREVTRQVLHLPLQGALLML